MPALRYQLFKRSGTGALTLLLALCACLLCLGTGARAADEARPVLYFRSLDTRTAQPSFYLEFNPNTNRSPFEYRFSQFRVTLNADGSLSAQQIALQPLHYDGEGRIISILDEPEGTTPADREKQFLSSTPPHEFLVMPGHERDSPLQIAYGYRALSHLSDYFYRRGDGQLLLLDGVPNDSGQHPDALATIPGGGQDDPVQILEVLDTGVYIYRSIRMDSSAGVSGRSCRFATIGGAAVGELPSKQLYACCSVDGNITCIDDGDYGIELWTAGEQPQQRLDLVLPDMDERSRPSFAACLPDSGSLVVIRNATMYSYGIVDDGSGPQLLPLGSWSPLQP